jgi:hypothetical protein
VDADTLTDIPAGDQANLPHMPRGGNVSRDPMLETADAAFAESLANAATESVILGFAEDFRDASGAALADSRLGARAVVQHRGQFVLVEAEQAEVVGHALQLA